MDPEDIASYMKQRPDLNINIEAIKQIGKLNKRLRIITKEIAIQESGVTGFFLQLLNIFRKKRKN